MRKIAVVSLFLFLFAPLLGEATHDRDDYRDKDHDKKEESCKCQKDVDALSQTVADHESRLSYLEMPNLVREGPYQAQAELAYDARQEFQFACEVGRLVKAAYEITDSTRVVKHDLNLVDNHYTIGLMGIPAYAYVYKYSHRKKKEVPVGATIYLTCLLPPVEPDAKPEPKKPY